EDLDVVLQDDHARQPLDVPSEHLIRRLEGSAEHPDEGGGPRDSHQRARDPDGHMEEPHVPGLQAAVRDADQPADRNHPPCSRRTRRCTTVTPTITTKSSIDTAAE